MNLATGHRLFQVRRHQRAHDFNATASVSVMQMIEMSGPEVLRRYSWRSGTNGMLNAHFSVLMEWTPSFKWAAMCLH
jgi:hypothetical protein